MRVHGVTIHDDQIASALEVMRGDFTFVQVMNAFKASGQPGNYEVGMWAADRLIRREVLAGRIMYSSSWGCGHGLVKGG